MEIANARAPKTPEEIEMMQETQRATDAAMAAVVEYLRTTNLPTSDEAHAIIDRVLAEHDCESPQGHIVAGGIQAVEPHEHGHGPIQKGVSIVIDIYPRLKRTGYFADMSRTVCIGEPSGELQRMFDTTLAAFELALGMVKPGVACKSIQETVEKFFADSGYETTGKGKEFTYAEGFVHAIGHGVGREIHERPHINRRSEEILQEGDVITIEPGLYYQRLGGIRIEDMVLVTHEGSRSFTQFTKKFVLDSH